MSDEDILALVVYLWQPGLVDGSHDDAVQGRDRMPAVGKLMWRRAGRATSLNQRQRDRHILIPDTALAAAVAEAPVGSPRVEQDSERVRADGFQANTRLTSWLP